MTEENGKKTIEISYVPDEGDADDISPLELREENKVSPKPAPRKKVSAKELQKKIKKQKETIEALEKERREYKDNYLRTLAEMDNYRKRIQKEKEDYQKYALSEFLLDLLQVYDNLERALKSTKAVANKESIGAKDENGNEESIISGVEMIYKQFSDILKKYDVVEIEALNQPFDPSLQQALTREEQEDIDEPLVVEVYQKGFLYSGKLLKAALVKVAVPIEDEEADSDEEETEEDE